MAELCVFVIGTESSGSKLAGRILAHALGIQPYGSWHGSGWALSDDSPRRLCHRSQPYGKEGTFSDIQRWNEDNAAFDIRYVICTRDTTISQRSRRERWPERPPGVLDEQTERARSIIREVMRTCSFTIWSYESFMFLGADYLQGIYRFLGIESSFMPSDVVDGNAKHVRAAV